MKNQPFSLKRLITSEILNEENESLNSNLTNKIIFLNKKLIVKLLVYLFISIAFLGLLAGLINYLFGNNLENNRVLYRFVQLFHMNLEANIPAWFSSFLMIIISALCLIISRISGIAIKNFFLVLSVIFILMSLDEIAGIHEILNNPVRNSLKIKGIFHWAWVVPGILVVLLFFIYFSKYFKYLNKEFLVWSILSGTVYLSGAILFEMLGGWLVSNDMSKSLYYIFEVFFEESLELLGLILFINTLLKYLINVKPFLNFKINP